MKAATTLGISPGTKFMGLAVMRSGLLIHHQVRSFPGKWSYKKLLLILSALESIMKRYDITGVAVKIPDILPATLGFSQLLGAFNVLCEGTIGKPRYYTFSKIKTRHCKGDKRTSAELMRIIAERYPELMPEYRKELANENAHYHKLFDAVAAALM